MKSGYLIALATAVTVGNAGVVVALPVSEPDIVEVICGGSGGGGTAVDWPCDGLGAQILCDAIAGICEEGETARVAEVLGGDPCQVICEWL